MRERKGIRTKSGLNVSAGVFKCKSFFAGAQIPSRVLAMESVAQTQNFNSKNGNGNQKGKTKLLNHELLNAQISPAGGNLHVVDAGEQLIFKIYLEQGIAGLIDIAF